MTSDIPKQPPPRAAAPAPASRAGASVAAALAHDLRAALSTVTAAMDLLARSGLTAEQEGLARTARGAALSALALADELGHPRLGARALTVTPEPVALADVLSRMEDTLAVRARAKGLDWRASRTGALPETVEADALRLHQIVENLITNAVAVSEAGTVRLTAEAEADGTGRIALRIHVADSGPGLPEGASETERLFAPYARGKAVRHEGRGLGLWIARTLAERMGGSLKAAHAAEGAVFTLAVRLAVPADAERHPPGTAPASSGLRALVVDDGYVNRALLKTMLGGMGLACESVASGQAAVAALLRGGHGLVLLDLNMPEMDGAETLRAIRALGERGSLPVVAVTAETGEESEARVHAAGFDGYLAKPVNAQSLHTVLHALGLARAG